MSKSTTIGRRPAFQGRRALVFALGAFVVYFLSAGPVTRCAPEFADWFYAPSSPLADVPLAETVLRSWLSLWGVDVS